MASSPRGLAALLSVEKLLASLSGGRLGRLLMPLTPVLVFFGLKERSNRYILNIGDEGATLVQIRGGQVVDAVFAEASSDEGWTALRETLAIDPKAPIILIADMVEQMFREDSVPRVGLLDRGKIIKRRLDLVYPNEILKAALPGPRKRGAPQPVLLTALPMSERLQSWIAFLDEIPNPARGFYMLPLEVTGLAARLAPPVENETRKVWRALLSQEAASGFRQVFDLDGKMVVTRLTQRASQPLSAEAEGMLIERELRSSISYLKRLGFSDGDRLDVVLLAEPAVCRAVDERDLPATSVTLYTPYQAGVMLGLGEIGRDDSPFADVLLGLWIAAKPRPVLKLPSPKIARQDRSNSILRWSAAATIALTVFALYYCGSLLTAYAGGGADMDSLHAEIDRAKATLATETQKMGNYPIPLDDLSDVAAAQERMLAQQVDLIELVHKVGVALGQDARATQLTYDYQSAVTTTSRPRNAAQAAPTAPTPVAYQLQVRVNIEVPIAGGVDTEAATRKARNVLARLADAFPGQTVQATQMPDNALHNETVEGSANQKTEAASKLPIAEFVIKRDR